MSTDNIPPIKENISKVNNAVGPKQGTRGPALKNCANPPMNVQVDNSINTTGSRGNGSGMRGTRGGEVSTSPKIDWREKKKV
jgi:hypothetical protein